MLVFVNLHPFPFLEISVMNRSFITKRVHRSELASLVGLRLSHQLDRNIFLTRSKSSHVTVPLQVQAFVVADSFETGIISEHTGVSNLFNDINLGVRLGSWASIVRPHDISTLNMPEHSVPLEILERNILPLGQVILALLESQTCSVVDLALLALHLRHNEVVLVAIPKVEGL